MQKEPKCLSSAAYVQATKFLRAEARPLEVARLESIFNGSGIVNVLIEMGKFQNTDGGFGHALEPDLRAPGSSALCTSVAFQIMRDHQVSRDEEMGLRGIRYLMETLDRSEFHWRIIPESAGSAPRAPWWNQEGREEEFRGFSLNPTAEVLGYLLDYGRPVADGRIISGPGIGLEGISGSCARVSRAILEEGDREGGEISFPGGGRDRDGKILGCT